MDATLTRLSACERIREEFPSSRGPVAQLGARFHGMEEVVGSIPTRSTNFLNNLDGLVGQSHDICVVSCVVTRPFGACGQGFHRLALGFHSDVTISLQHPFADVA